MKKLLLLSCIILCAIQGYGQDTSTSYTPKKWINELDSVLSARGVKDTPDIRFTRYWKVNDTLGSISIQLWNDVYDTSFVIDTLHPDNVVGVLYDGTLRMVNVKAMVHTYWHRVRHNQWAFMDYDNQWDHKFILIDGPAFVLNKISFLYSYEDGKADGSQIHLMSIESCPNNYKGCKLINKVMGEDCPSSIKPAKAKYFVWWKTAPRAITVLWFYYQSNADYFKESNKGKWYEYVPSNGKDQWKVATFHVQTSKGYPALPAWLDNTYLDQQAFGDKP